jgi:uncharacterized membrane protein YdjX (TVP38/TMEM64 family)
LSDADLPPSEPTILERLRRLGPTAILAVLSVALPPLGSLILFWKITPISEWLRSHFATGSITFILCCWVFGGLGVMPQHTMSILGGWAFGFWAGLGITLISFMGAGLVGYGIAYYFSGDRVMQQIDENPKWKRVHHALVNGSWWHTLLIVFLIRLTPNMPFALTNVVMATTGVKLGKFLLGTFLGLIPRTTILVYTASEMSTLDLENAGDRRLLIFAIIAALVALISITLVAKSALKRATMET